MAYTHQRSEYGLPSHTHDGKDHDRDEYTSFMKFNSQRWDLRSECCEPVAGFARLRVRAAATNY